jgi:hypothetical protein
MHSRAPRKRESRDGGFKANGHGLFLPPGSGYPALRRVPDLHPPYALQLGATPEAVTSSSKGASAADAARPFCHIPALGPRPDHPAQLALPGYRRLTLPPGLHVLSPQRLHRLVGACHRNPHIKDPRA